MDGHEIMVAQKEIMMDEKNIKIVTFQSDNSAYEPKKLKREKVKEVLLSFRRSLQENVSSECTGCSVTTFEYI